MGLIRLLLAISVVIAHSSPIFGLKFVGGQIAVQSFYIISGFYMALILSSKYTGPGSYKTFITNRFLKLFPTYWLILVLTLIIGFISKSIINDSVSFEAFYKYKDQLHLSTWVYFLIVNLTIFGQDIANFLGLNLISGWLEYTPNFRSYSPETWNFLLLPQSWSIAIELTFYLIAPALLKLRTKYLLIIMSISLILRLIFYRFVSSGDPWTYRFFPFEIFFFLLGAISFRLYKKIEALKFNSSHLTFALITLVLLIIFYQFIPSNTKKKLVFYFLIPILVPFIFKMTNKSKFDQTIGELSYPIYMFHFLVINILTHIFKVQHNFLGLFSTLISIVASLGLYKILILPLNSFRQSRVKASAS